MRLPNGVILGAWLAFVGGGVRLGAELGRPNRAARCPLPGTAPEAIAVGYRGVVTRLSVSSAFVLPGDTLDLKVGVPSGAGPVAVRASAGVLNKIDASTWRWQAPRTPGSYALQVIPMCGSDSVTVRAFVMVPATAVHGGYLHGFRIGNYPRAPSRRQAVYRPPVGFVEVTPQNQDLFLTPHFQLRQFLTKQPGGFPKYVALDPRLLLKLEYIVGLAQAQGYGTIGFHVMSGYRTPAYNRALGNVPNSRHLYGAAADIFIDEHPKDGVMDDLNKDGRIDILDAAVLYRLIDRHKTDLAYRAMVGGLAMYPSTSAHGPFVHVDVRGYPARW
jgi:Peptidase M15